jgi:hypothetical protein
MNPGWCSIAEKCNSFLLSSCEAFMAVIIQVEVFWFMTPSKVVVGYQGFGDPCYVHLHVALKMDL